MRAHTSKGLGLLCMRAARRPLWLWSQSIPTHMSNHGSEDPWQLMLISHSQQAFSSASCFLASLGGGGGGGGGRPPDPFPTARRGEHIDRLRRMAGLGRAARVGGLGPSDRRSIVP